jgi:hypothetical protein
MTARTARGSAARSRREERTISVMVALYCRDHHGAERRAADARGVGERTGASDALCAECAALLDYARRRLAACRYGAAKPTCAACPTHCYRPASRDHVRMVMRYSGPRMVTRHPVLAMAHLLDKRRRP